MKITKTVITAFTRQEFENIVFNGMLSDDETKVLELYIKNKTVFETAEMLNMTNRQVELLRKSIRKKLNKVF